MDTDMADGVLHTEETKPLARQLINWESGKMTCNQWHE